jgi:hypothetical protein
LALLGIHSVSLQAPIKGNPASIFHGNDHAAIPVIMRLYCLFVVRYLNGSDTSFYPKAPEMGAYGEECLRHQRLLRLIHAINTALNYAGCHRGSFV